MKRFLSGKTFFGVLLTGMILFTVLSLAPSAAQARGLNTGSVKIVDLPSPLKAFSFHKKSMVPLRRADFFIKSQSPQDYLFGKVFKKESPKCEYVVFPVYGNSMYVFRSGRSTARMLEMVRSGDARGIKADTRKYDKNCFPFNELTDLNGLTFIFQDRDSNFWRMDIIRVMGDNVDFTYEKVK